MTADAFEGLLLTIIDTHREAERNRKLWARIWAVLALSIGVFALGGWHRLANAEPVKAYPGSKLLWDYEWTVPGGGFPIQVNGSWVVRAAMDVREIPLSELKLSEGEHLIQIRARAADGRVSEWASINVFYSLTLPEPLPMPSSIRIQMEWTVEE